MDCLFLLLWSLQVPLVNSTSVRLLASVSFGNFIKAGDTLIINYLLLYSLSFSKLIVVSCLRFCRLCSSVASTLWHRSHLPATPAASIKVRVFTHCNCISILNYDKPMIDADAALTLWLNLTCCYCRLYKYAEACCIDLGNYGVCNINILPRCEFPVPVVVR